MAEPGRSALRVLFVCQNDFETSSEKQAVAFARELLARGHAAMIAIGGDLETARRERADRIDGLELASYGFRGRRLIERDGASVGDFAPTIVHAYNPHVPVIAAARCFAAEQGAPVFVHFEDDEWKLQPFEGETLYHRAGRHARRLAGLVMPGAWYWSNALSRRWVARHSAGLDALTPTLAAQVERRTGRPCSVVLPAVPEPGRNEPAELRADLLGEGTDPIALFTGTVWPAYLPNLLLGLRAVALVRDRGLPLRFVHAGRVHPRIDVERLGHEAGLPEGAAVTIGQLPFRSVPALLERGAVLLQPGAPSAFNRFGLPTKLMSYLRSGRPTIMFAAGPGELLVDRDEVLKTYGGEPEELADRICEVLTDRDLRERLAHGGPAAARRLFDPARNTEALVAHYRGALRSEERRPAGTDSQSSSSSSRSIDAT